MGRAAAERGGRSGATTGVGGGGRACIGARSGLREAAERGAQCGAVGHATGAAWARDRRRRRGSAAGGEACIEVRSGVSGVDSGVLHAAE